MKIQKVLDEPNNNTIFMVWNFKENQNSTAINSAFNKICALVIGLNNSANVRFPESCASVVMGIGFEAWQSLNLPTPLPKEFVKFQTIKGAKHTAVSTKGDLHFHIRANEHSYCIDCANAITNILQNVACSASEIHGFRYWDGRSILGFVDGTENPTGIEREHFAVIGNEDPSYKGGSYLFVQKYLHNLKAWQNLSVSEQEKVIGRTKEHDIELSDEQKPANSHIALANVGEDLKVIRDNMPFGSISTNEMGTYFIAYARKFNTIQKMLNNMFIGNPPGNYDRILDFSFAQTGTLFFVPSLTMLSDFA